MKPATEPHGLTRLTAVVLAVAAFLSKLLGVGRAPDWAVILKDLPLQAPMIILGAPLALLDGYFQIYHAGPFFTSLAVGGLLGWHLVRPK